MEAESSEALAFKKQFSLLCSTIGPELGAIATELYSKGMISGDGRDKAYAGSVNGFVVDIECKIKTDSTYFHDFVKVLEAKESLRGLASRLAADHRRLSTPTTTAEKVAVHRSGFDHIDSVEERIPTSNRNTIPCCTSPADFSSEMERSRSFSNGRNQERTEQECPLTSPQPESVPIAETSGYSPSSTQLASGLHDRLRRVEDYVTSNYVGRPEAESQAKQVEELTLRLKGMRIELSEKDKAILNLQVEKDQFKDDVLYYARKCRTLEVEREELRCKVGDLEKQCATAKEQASASARSASILQQLFSSAKAESKAKPCGRCKSWPATR